jgi:hypothetical protein
VAAVAEQPAKVVDVIVTVETPDETASAPPPRSEELADVPTKRASMTSRESETNWTRCC